MSTHDRIEPWGQCGGDFDRTQGRQSRRQTEQRYGRGHSSLPQAFLPACTGGNDETGGHRQQGCATAKNQSVDDGGGKFTARSGQIGFSEESG